MAEGNEQAIIIKKVIKGGGGHHGGAWKVAYADFVTAMMAFFLLLWLLNVTTDEQKAGIADYFAPTAASRSQSGSGQMLAGRTMSTEGAKASNTAPPSVVVTLSPPDRAPDKGGDFKGATDEDGDKGSGMLEGNKNSGKAETEEQEQATGQPSTRQLEAEELLRQMAEHEQQLFEEAEEMIREAIDESPDLRDLQDHLMIDNTPEGLRIQVVDQEGRSMFPSGAVEMNDRAMGLLGKVAEVIKQLPNNISITGHTDSTPFRSRKGYSNWELSSDRANASRRAMIDLGISPGRIAYVTGKADTEPLIKEDPAQPNNRRIAIVLLRENKLPAPPAAAQ